MEQKKLTELSLDELWQLFPITLTTHQDSWADWYKEEAVYFCYSKQGCIFLRTHIHSESGW